MQRAAAKSVWRRELRVRGKWGVTGYYEVAGKCEEPVKFEIRSPKQIRISKFEDGASLRRLLH